MEQLIVVAIFALCAAACVRILAESYLTAGTTRDTSNAIHAAESCAECYKAVSGDIDKTAEILGGSTLVVDGRPAAVVYYDGNWVMCGESGAEGESGPAYRLLLAARPPGSERDGLSYADLSVEKAAGKAAGSGDFAWEMVFELTVATRAGEVQHE